MQKQILHIDMNSFYASVEQAYNPSLRGKAVAVAGRQEERHGIILAKSQEAKQYGVKTGEPIWQARQKCPNLIIVDAHFERYFTYSHLAHGIYLDYTDQVEPYGLDECWLDVSGSVSLFGNGETLARTIRARIWKELGVTVSIGISNNKIFAKLGSDYRKPDAQTYIHPQNYQRIVWPLPASDLLFVGPHTKQALSLLGVKTIGDLARSDPVLIQHRFGINGKNLWLAANGKDRTPVATYTYQMLAKSISCGTTFRQDLLTEDDIRPAILRLAEGVEERLIASGLAAQHLSISLRDNNLHYLSNNTSLAYPTQNAVSLSRSAFSLTLEARQKDTPLRAITLAAGELVSASTAVQSVFFRSVVDHDKQECVGHTIHEIRARFGKRAAERASLSNFTGANLDQPRPSLPVNLFAALRANDLEKGISSA